MPTKRKRQAEPRTASGRPTKKRGVFKMNKNIRDTFQKMFNRNVETKESVSTANDGVEMFHNSIYVRKSDLLLTTQGTADPKDANASNRIGDKVALRGLSVKVMFELNERYSMGTFRIFIVKSAKGDVPTNGTLFNGVSGNKMIDSLNTERYTILARKTFTIKQSSTGMVESGIQEVGSGFTKGVSDVSRATKIVSLWVPGNKIVRGGNLIYESGTSQPKFYDYHLVYYAYSNYSTSNTYYVARINDEVVQLYYKDA